MMYRLQPIRLEDEAMILAARNAEHVRMFMMTQSIITPEVHAAWIRAKLAREREPYYLFLHGDRPIGVVGITHYAEALRSGEWGFYIFATDAPKGAGTTMLAAFLDEVFRQGFGRVTSLVFTDNVKSHRLHEKLGFTRDSVIVGFVQNKDVTVWALNGLQWQRQRENFLEMINAVQVESL